MRIPAICRLDKLKFELINAGCIVHFHILNESEGYCLMNLN